MLRFFSRNGDSFLLVIKNSLALDVFREIGLPSVVDGAVVVDGKGVLVHINDYHQVKAVWPVNAGWMQANAVDAINIGKALE